MLSADAQREKDEMPVLAEETLLRRVQSKSDCYNEKTKKPLMGAFLPARDSDGLSLNREDAVFFETPDTVLAKCNDPEIRDYGGVAAIQCQLLTDNGMSAKPDSIEESRGHIIIPEIKGKEYYIEDLEAQCANRQKIKALARSLALNSHLKLEPKPKPK